jgi:hypothetical protein
MPQPLFPCSLVPVCPCSLVLETDHPDVSVFKSGGNRGRVGQRDRTALVFGQGLIGDGLLLHLHRDWTNASNQRRGRGKPERERGRERD